MAEKQQYLVLVRHGQSQANVLTGLPSDEHYYQLSGSDRAVGLTDEGLAQSLAAGRRLAAFMGQDERFEHLFVSPFRRTRQTADALSAELGYAPGTSEDERLCKRSYGEFWNLTYRGLQDLHPGEFARFQREGGLVYRAPGGENYLDVFARVDNFLDETVGPAKGHILVVTHSVVVLSLQRRLEGLPDQEVMNRYETVALPNGHILVYSRAGANSPWQRVLLDELPAS